MMVLKCIPLRQHSKFPHLTFSQIVLQPTLLGSARHFPSSLPLGRMLCPLVESYLKPPGDVFYHILCLDLLNLWYNETFERGAISNQYSLCFSTHLYKTKCLGQTFTQARSVCFFPNRFRASISSLPGIGVSWRGVSKRSVSLNCLWLQFHLKQKNSCFLPFFCDD